MRRVIKVSLTSDCFGASAPPPPPGPVKHDPSATVPLPLPPLQCWPQLSQLASTLSSSVGSLRRKVRDRLTPQTEGRLEFCQAPMSLDPLCIAQGTLFLCACVLASDFFVTACSTDIGDEKCLQHFGRKS